MYNRIDVAAYLFPYQCHIPITSFHMDIIRLQKNSVKFIVDSK